MTREDLLQLLEKGPVLLDGATGSNLQKKGMLPGECPELWILNHEDIFLELQNAYVEAGTQILYAPTFTANRIKLKEYGVEERIKELNHNLIGLSKKAAHGKAFVAADLTMTGEALEPTGTMKLEELIGIYKEQVRYTLEAGADLFVIETMMSIAEARAAVIAVKESCDLPVMVTMTFQEDGRTLYGTDPVTAVVVLQSIGADVIGINCSTGPKEMLPMLSEMKEYAEVPLLVKPNAGLPVLEDGVTVYPMLPEEFAQYGKDFIEAGAGFLGGCCGTTPEHIAALSKAVSALNVKKPCNQHKRMLASERKSQEVCLDGGFLVIGERINPTGKKKLQEELRAGKLDLIEQMAEEQEEMGAHILDVNVGTSGIDEKEMMLAAIEKVSMTSKLPLCIDTSYVDVMEAALRAYPGRALVNSVSLEKEKIERLLPLVKKYGAMFILLPLSDAGLPKTLEEKIHIINQIMEEAAKLGIPKEDIIVDGLVTTVGANKKAGLETLETIRYCKEQLGVATSIGLSNISFGLPERSYVNGAFAAMAVQNGLTMAIANPSNDLLMGISYAADLLLNKDQADLSYINQVKRMQPLLEAKVTAKREVKVERKIDKQADSLKNAVMEAVVKGNIKGICDLVKAEISYGSTPKVILDEMLIPGINKVGELFDQQEYFLPQLIASANAMKEGINYLEPMLATSADNKEKKVVVIATVEGDIHDIGKNLVALMLKNYGFDVHDLGKDVLAEEIIDEAETYNASIIVLSALMTTTMMKMKDVIALRNERGLSSKVMIGGAVTTQEFADEIGADGYSKDAAEAVKLAKSLL